jgi:hypothetical protein
VCTLVVDEWANYGRKVVWLCGWCTELDFCLQLRPGHTAAAWSMGSHWLKSLWRLWACRPCQLGGLMVTANRQLVNPCLCCSSYRHLPVRGLSTAWAIGWVLQEHLWTFRAVLLLRHAMTGPTPRIILAGWV